MAQTMAQTMGSGGGSASFANYGAGGAGVSADSYSIDSRLEQQTKKICRAMGGEQPTNAEWDTFFMKSRGSGAYGGVGMSMAINEKMKMAHNVAKAQSASR
jgi:hypothetical protein